MIHEDGFGAFDSWKGYGQVEKRTRMRRNAAGNAKSELGHSKTATVLIDSFAHNLRRARVAAGLSQSDLARKIWGTEKTKDGYIVARKRERISSYESGAQAPSNENLTAIAKALGKDPLELAPEMSRNAEFRESDAISMTMVRDQPERVHLRVNVLTQLDVASKIIAMLSES